MTQPWLSRFMLACLAATLVLVGPVAYAQDASKPIRIGIIASLTGAFAENIKPATYADEVWDAQVNARGGLLGRKVVFTVVDNKSNPETGVSLFERMSQENYDFIFENSGWTVS